MHNLVNLCYLGYSEINFPGIGKLTLLQELRKFIIKNENGYKIEELGQMNELRILRIDNLEDVRAVEEARNAKLCDKRKLMQLSLHWGDGHSIQDGDHDLEERVLRQSSTTPLFKDTLDVLLHGCQVCHMDERGPFDEQSSGNLSTWLLGVGNSSIIRAASLPQDFMPSSHAKSKTASKKI